MHADSLRPSQLSDLQREAWQSLRAEQPELRDPFFAWEFFQLLEEVRGEVEVALLGDEGRGVGFLPFERRGSAGYPAGSRVSEIQGPIAPAGLAWNPEQWLQGVGLSAWYSPCTPASAAALQPYQICGRRFPCIDLAGGWSGYEQDRRQAGSQQIEQSRRKARKLQRECGPIRFDWHAADADVLDQLVRWKSEQYQRTGVRDLFASGWVRELARRAQRLTGERLAGVLSAVYCRDEPIAIHLGLRSDDVLCWWLPAYDPRFARYSPGSILLLRVIEAAAERGISRLHLGQGDERYKLSWSNASFPVAEGSVHRRAWDRTVSRTWIHLRDWAQRTPMCARPLRVFRSVRNRLSTG